jgi:glyoxylase-like metal-dependent hydrolase (beta-lactamase superfamily II)
LKLKIRIYDVGSNLFRNYLLQTPLGWIAVDTGYAGGFSRFARRFTKLAPLSELKYVFLTHAHDDHAGYLSELLQASGARLVCNVKSLPVLASGENPVPEGAGYANRAALLFAIIKKAHSFPAYTPDAAAIRIEIETDQLFQALGLPVRVLHLPGHTADSLGLLLEETGDLLCGDAAMNSLISPARHTIWIEDPAEFGRSWDRMLACKPTRILPSHGRPFPPGDLVKYRHWFEGRALIPPK